jgi:heme/copper-type cytochrome/quinol oxidase subunit 2
LPDIQYLCDDVVIPSLAQNGWTDGEIVISLSDKEVAFGVASPDVVQYFQPFSIQAGACMWEDF